MTAPKLPPREEWDFASEGKREWTGLAWRVCYYYEFARHRDVVDKIVARFRKGISPTRFDDSKAAIPQPESGTGLETHSWIRFITRFPEWPEIPFTRIDKSERNRRIEAVNPTNSPNRDGASVLQSDLNYVIGSYMDFATLPKPNSDEEFEHFVDGTLYGPLWNGRETIVTYPGMELVCFEIDWTQGSTQICRDFAKWVRDHHPRKIPLLARDASGNIHRVDKGKALLSVKRDHHPKDWPLLGRDASGHIWLAAPNEEVPSVSAPDGRIPRETKGCQDALRYLGAYRIWDAFGGNWAKLDAAFQGNVCELKTVMGDQYSYQSAWSRARQQTKQQVAKFNT